ncbi:MAG: HDOD domain-containing protein [Granulosicoccus sp.]
MKKILFVDDEPAVLDGLQDLLHGLRRRWDMSFICGGEAAIATMDDSDYDVVVSDIRMPGVGGVEVLEYAKKHHPQSIRIALTGYADAQSTIELTRLAHRYLRKPCSLDDLDEVISRDCGLIQAFDNVVVKELVGQAGRLPANSSSHQALLEALDAGNVSIEEITKIVEQDVALTAKVLQLVNSSFFRRQRSIDSANEAVGYLGVDILRSLVLANQMFEMTKGLPKIAGFDPKSLQQHCILTSTIARELTPNIELSKIAFTAGLLHDVGKFVIAQNKPELIPALVGKSDGLTNSWVNAESERDILGCTHAEVGGSFLNLWGLPTPIVEAVTFHDNPTNIFTSKFDAIDIVHVSNYLAHWAGDEAADERLEAKLDREYLKNREVYDQLDSWKEQALDAHNDAEKQTHVLY